MSTTDTPLTLSQTRKEKHNAKRREHKRRKREKKEKLKRLKELEEASKNASSLNKLTEEQEALLKKDKEKPVNKLKRATIDFVETLLEFFIALSNVAEEDYTAQLKFLHKFLCNSFESVHMNIEFHSSNINYYLHNTAIFNYIWFFIRDCGELIRYITNNNLDKDSTKLKNLVPHKMLNRCCIITGTKNIDFLDIFDEESSYSHETKITIIKYFMLLHKYSKIVVDTCLVNRPYIQKARLEQQTNSEASYIKDIPECLRTKMEIQEFALPSKSQFSWLALEQFMPDSLIELVNYHIKKRGKLPITEEHTEMLQSVMHNLLGEAVTKDKKDVLNKTIRTTLSNIRNVDLRKLVRAIFNPNTKTNQKVIQKIVDRTITELKVEIGDDGVQSVNDVGEHLMDAISKSDTKLGKMLGKFQDVFGTVSNEKMLDADVVIEETDEQLLEELVKDQAKLGQFDKLKETAKLLNEEVANQQETDQKTTEIINEFADMLKQNKSYT